MTKVKEKKDVSTYPYCAKCEFCGYIDCCGVRRFLEKHVKGKTTCLNEAMFIEEILWLYGVYKDGKLSTVSDSENRHLL